MDIFLESGSMISRSLMEKIILEANKLFLNVGRKIVLNESGESLSLYHLDNKGIKLDEHSLDFIFPDINFSMKKIPLQSIKLIKAFEITINGR